MQRTDALRTPDFKLPSPDCHITFVTRHPVGRRNYTNIGKVSFHLPVNVTQVKGMSVYLPSRDLL
jgi:hypothetical protein